MSHSKHHYLAIVPLLSLLAMSPAQFETKTISRSLASVVEQEVEKPFPRYEALAGKINRKALMPDKNLTKESFDGKVKSLKDKLALDRKEIKVEIKDKEEIALQNEKALNLVTDIILIEEDLKVIQEKKLMDEPTLKLAEERVKDFKTTLEGILTDIHNNEVLADKPAEPKKEEPAVVTDAPKKEEPAVVATDPAKEEVATTPAKEEKKEEKPSSEICALQDQNKLLTKQVEELLADQKKINESLVNITSTLAQLVQHQMNPWNNYLSGPMPGLTYSQQYPVPQNMGGQWVYMTNPQQAYAPQFQVPSFQDQSLMQTLQLQQGQQMNQNLNQPFVYNNGFGMQQSQGGMFSNEAYNPISMAPQYLPGTLGQPQGLSNMMVNFSPSSLML